MDTNKNIGWIRWIRHIFEFIYVFILTLYYNAIIFCLGVLVIDVYAKYGLLSNGYFRITLLIILGLGLMGGCFLALEKLTEQNKEVK